MLDILKGVVSPILDKLIPDADERQKYKTKMLELYAQEQFGEEERRYNAIQAEAQSCDPWTSRARPAFLYVFYALVLFSLPFGMFSAYDPETAKAVQEGASSWLHGMPEELWILFGAGYLGYVKKRSDDKETLTGVRKDKSIIQRLF